MIARWHRFSDDELAEVRLGLEALYSLTTKVDPVQDPVNSSLIDEIEHLQEQRRMAARREELPG